MGSLADFIHSAIDAFNEQEEKLEANVAEIRAFAESESDNMKQALYAEFGSYQAETIASFFEESIDEFYDAYDPIHGRNRSLYDALDLSFDELGTVDYDNPEDLSLYDQSLPVAREGGSLFDLVMVRGYHGGATGTDSHGISRSYPHYREPYGFYWHWGEPAVRTKSPVKIMAEKLSRAEGGEIFDEFKLICDRHNNEFIAKVNQKIREIM